MTKNEILEGNRLIVEFMQLEMNEFGHYVDKDHLFSSQLKLFPFELRFDSSWDWLIPVIDKIENIGEDDQCLEDNFHFFIGKRFVRVVYDWNTYSTFDENNSFADLEKYNKSQREYRYNLYGTKLETVWQAVVDFIRWYNIKIMDIDGKEHEYTVRLFGSLEDCKYQYDKKIGSYWCTAECPYCTNLLQEIDQHGRLDLIRFNCIAK